MQSSVTVFTVNRQNWKWLQKNYYLERHDQFAQNIIDLIHVKTVNWMNKDWFKILLFGEKLTADRFS